MDREDRVSFQHESLHSGKSSHCKRFGHTAQNCRLVEQAPTGGGTTDVSGAVIPDISARTAQRTEDLEMQMLGAGRL
ncbi:hypothetical protein L1987_33009 [Smallanthus sonchifolius]|uniref:Uncharacterized protein n=1 Tax=Smallanthus sonchifolius TaxID=185202 RepID=A0ACB9HR15_9ASTR|nr:hypothetical protein L1987_33009 [Smallanthus sonchifolius]